MNFDQFIKISFVILTLCSSLLRASEISIDSLVATQEVKGIAVVVVSPKGMGVSAFGHLFIRLLLNPKLPSPNDPVIEFAADSNGKNYQFWKGMGVGNNLYPMGVKIITYRQMMDEKSFNEGRDLKNLVLNIPESKINDFLKSIQTSIRDGLPTYKFFSYNCATAVTQVLANGLGMKKDELETVLPTRISTILKEKNLVLSEFIDESGFSIKKKYFKAFSTKVENLMSSQDPYKLIQKHILADSLPERILGYLKLRASYIQTQSNQIKSLAFSLISQEPLSTQKDLNELFITNLNPKWMLYELPEQQLLPNSKYMIQNHEIKTIDKNTIQLSLLGLETPTPCKIAVECSGYKTSIDIPLGSDFKVVGQQLFWKNVLVGQWEASPTKGNLIHFGFHLVALIDASQNNQTDTLRTYLIFDFKSSVQKWFDKKKRNLGQDLIAVTNQETGGACGSLVETQHTILKQAVFLPSMPRLKTNEEYISLLEQALKGHIIFIPGYKNGFELTKTIPKDMFVAFLHKSLNEISLVKKGLNAKKLKNQNDLEKIKSRLDLGLQIPLILDLEDTYINHALLILSYNEKDNDFITYDPNFGIFPIKLEYQNGEIKLISSTYKVRSTYAEFSDINSELAFRASKLNMDEASILNYIKEYGRYSW